MSTFVPAIIFLLLMYGGAQAKNPSDDHHAWSSYANARFQYTICYPEDLFAPQGEADNGDGRRFSTKDGAVLTVYGSNNALSQSMSDLLAETAARLAEKSGTVTYKALKPKWFVVSGESGDNIFYAKTIYNKREDQFKSFELHYPKVAAPIYDSVIAHIAACFSSIGR